MFCRKPDGEQYTKAVEVETGGIYRAEHLTDMIREHHTSLVNAQNPQPKDSIPAQGPTVQAYLTEAPAGPTSNKAIQPTGGSQPHENMQPYLCVSFIISLFGIFPSPT